MVRDLETSSHETETGTSWDRDRDRLLWDRDWDQKCGLETLTSQLFFFGFSEHTDITTIFSGSRSLRGHRLTTRNKQQCVIHYTKRYNDVYVSQWTRKHVANTFLTKVVHASVKNSYIIDRRTPTNLFSKTCSPQVCSSNPMLHSPHNYCDWKNRIVTAFNSHI